MRKSGENYVFEFLRLRRDSRGDARVGVPVKVHPPGGNRIQNAAAIVRIEPDAFGARNVQRRRIERRICKRMPNAQRRIHCWITAKMPRDRNGLETPASALYDAGLAGA